ncbi:MAG: SDR family NAD(P)-dependent oxidoreductase [Dehalococcoidales bacterium]|nr:MAG: SDR family NAD(P)-dependent oxidoreductase [Dehalococcoidales bacterium]
MKDFAGKVAFITGGASGAGLGQAKVFSEAGCKVVIADIRQDHLDEAMAYFKEKNAEVHAIKMDLTDRQAYIAAADEVEKVYGEPPQLVIQTAGVNTFGPAESSTFEDFDWVVGVDLDAVIDGMVIFVPRMIQAGKGGHIAAVSSWGGFLASPGCTPYSVAKAGVNMLMECYWSALKPYGIGVTCLCPTNIRSNIGEAVYTRPEHLQNTGYHVNEKTIDHLRQIHAQGMDPVELAQRLKKGIEDDVLFVLPFTDDPEAEMKRHCDTLMNYVTKEGMERLEEENRKRREAMARASGPAGFPQNDVGWGKARSDLTWVKNHYEDK